METLSTTPALPQRPNDGHKGTFGTVLVVGGSAANPTMAGAPALALRGALRAGCGLAKALVPEPIVHTVITLCPSATAWGLAVDANQQIDPARAPEAVDTATDGARAVVLGCGLGQSDGPHSLVSRAIASTDSVLVLDADALALMPPDAVRARTAPTILTPHPGEFRALATRVGIDPEPKSDAERTTSAHALAGALHAIVVLKGHRTVVADANRVWTCAAGGPVLATAGTGDVLAGIIAGLAAHGISQSLDAYECARAGVLVHATAGEVWSASHGATAGMLAMELADAVPAACARLRNETAASVGPA